MESNPFQLSEVLAIAKLHPFYVPKAQYPPDVKTIKTVQEDAKRGVEKPDLGSQKLLQKKDLYHVIDRLVRDTSPKNTYRQSCYTSMTGGGSGGTPLFFATDVHENRRHRAHFGNFMRATGLVKETDWILSTHFEGHIYRSMDLVVELAENGGASVLCGGSYMTGAEVAKALTDYQVNTLAGESSSVINAIQYISTLSKEESDLIRIDKVIYTSEMMTPVQRAFIETTLGAVKIYSIMGSAEAGPWAVSSPDLTDGRGSERSQDFVFDTRSMLIEIIAPSVMETGAFSAPKMMPDGEQGIIVQTSLQRLRNPLVRYITGDIGSLHPLPESTRGHVSDEDWKYFRIVRLYGRDRRFSFEWDGMYFEFENFATQLNAEECGVLQWQLILDRLKSSPRSTIETRILRPSGNPSLLSEEALSERIKAFFNVYSGSKDRFSVIFLDDRKGFVRSSTGDKIIKFVDRFN